MVECYLASSYHRRQFDSDIPGEAMAGQSNFNGLIQHSFALRVPVEFCPQYTRPDITDFQDLLARLLTEPAIDQVGPRFELTPLTDLAEKRMDGVSLLADQELANLKLWELPLTGYGQEGFSYKMPAPFSWAMGRRKVETYGQLRDPVKSWTGSVVVAGNASDRPRLTDYVIVRDGPRVSPEEPHGVSAAADPNDPLAVSWLLCQLLAHRRSRLFGSSMSRRVFNVLLPYAILYPQSICSLCPSGPWILQPSLSLFLAGHERGFRSIFSLTLFLVPVSLGELSDENRNGSPRVVQRPICRDEIHQTVEPGWSIATSPPKGTRPVFDVGGPLCEYLDMLNPSTPACSDISAPTSQDGAAAWGGLTLRRIAEATFYETALRMVQGPHDAADQNTQRELGDRVLTSLSASRTSAAVFIDKEFERGKSLQAERAGAFPGSLEDLMQSIARPLRIKPRQRYRLDRFLFDEDHYAIGVLPANRCVVVTSDSKAQCSQEQSALVEIGWVAYMVIGAATATGMMRALYSDIENVGTSSPEAIAAIEREVVVDLHEIYDLDITWEVYKHRYRMLRDRLGITRDYAALQSKLTALSQETNTRFDDSVQTRLMWLTAAIVLLTFVAVIVTVVLK